MSAVSAVPAAPQSSADPGWRRWRAVVSIVVLVVVAGGTTHHLWAEPGWPSSHEGTAFAVRTEVYADHLRAGDVLPVWSSRDNAGFGSPQPALYHKLFYLTSGTLRAAGTPIRAALVLAVVGFLVVGAAGTRRLATILGSSEPFSTAAGVALLLANYTATNWLTRGALAELSAAMLVPWFLVAVAASIERRCVQWSVAFSAAAMYWAHSVLCAYVVALSGAGLAIAMALRWLDRATFLSRRAAGVAAVGAALVAPAALVTRQMVRGYDLSRMLPPTYLPDANIAPFSRYLYDPGWHWGERVAGLTVMLDTPMLLLAIASLGAWLLNRSPAVPAWPASARWAALVLGLTLLLQTQAAGVLYRNVPGADYLQFPWRLLALVTPLVIVLAIGFLERAAARTVGVAMAAIALGAMLLLGPTFATLHDERLALDAGQPGVVFGSFGEFVPTAEGSPSPRSGSAIELEQARQRCTVNPAPTSGADVTSLSFDVDCDVPAVIPLPVFRNDLQRVSVEGAGTSAGCRSVDGWEAYCGVGLPAGPTHIVVRLPRFWDVLRGLL